MTTPFVDVSDIERRARQLRADYIRALFRRAR